MDRDAIFYELTRSICPACRRVIDAQMLLRENKVYRRKRCPEHGVVEALIYGKEVLLPGGKQIPFCAYNSIGYREQARCSLPRERARARARRAGVPFEPDPLTFTFA